ncbi:MAG TPA: DUF1800 domain-containing protein [Acidimicrobiales bacterium]|nr:DUF1800 domain-containing protein [Acidimicrobiales bacterium]
MALRRSVASRPQTQLSESQLLYHLYQRAGFGLTSTELQSCLSLGFAGCVDQLIAGLTAPLEGVVATPPTMQRMSSSVTSNTNQSTEYNNLINWWINSMVGVTPQTALREKLVLLLHNQFPTSLTGVGWVSMMYDQNQLFRLQGSGRYDDLVHAMAKQPAMLLWLNAGQDVKSSPNQNFARELMERFCMGVTSGYTQNDVVAGARAFTGWALNSATGQFEYNSANADQGQKTFLGQTGNFDGDQVIDIVTQNPHCAPFVISRLWSWIGYPVTPTDPVVADLAPGFAANMNMSDLLAAMFNHPAFVSTQALTGLVKQPAEWLVGAMRTLGLTTASFGSPNFGYWTGTLGQQLFEPPNVGGWGQNQYWLSTSTAQSRVQIAFDLTSAVMSTLGTELASLTTTAQRAELLATTLGVNAWSSSTMQAFTNEQSNWQNQLALALVSPEYLVN